MPERSFVPVLAYPPSVCGLPHITGNAWEGTDRQWAGNKGELWLVKVSRD